ncbi:UNVERIFIED_CONTAM: hypothetical protein K2H54_070719 [Gekko kuhli]
MSITIFFSQNLQEVIFVVFQNIRLKHLSNEIHLRGPGVPSKAPPSSPDVRFLGVRELTGAVPCLEQQAFGWERLVLQERGKPDLLKFPARRCSAKALESFYALGSSLLREKSTTFPCVSRGAEETLPLGDEQLASAVHAVNKKLSKLRSSTAAVHGTRGESDPPEQPQSTRGASSEEAAVPARAGRFCVSQAPRSPPREGGVPQSNPGEFGALSAGGGPSALKAPSSSRGVSQRRGSSLQETRGRAARATEPRLQLSTGAAVPPRCMQGKLQTSYIPSE